MGITMGYHRLYTHKSYEAHPVIRFILLILGAMTLQNSAYKWASDHRIHHQHVDQENDPYNAKRGFWFSHIGWVFYKEPENRTYENVADLAKDKWVMWQDRYYVWIAFSLGWGLPLLIGLFYGRPIGFFLWAGLIRTVLVHHSTFFINSLAHIVGKQTYDDKTTARDSGLIAIFSFGEGYHNFHHRFQRDYRNGVRWYHCDPSKWLVAFLSIFGLTKNLRRYPDNVILSQKLAMDLKRVKTGLWSKIPKEKWHAITLELETAKESLEKTLLEWKESLHKYSEMKKDMPSAQELKEKFKAKLKRQKVDFHCAMENWNALIQYYMKMPVWAEA
jgi:stearoyl-CoA desaturase (delta-9 desaturase)